MQVTFLLLSPSKAVTPRKIPMPSLPRAAGHIKLASLPHRISNQQNPGAPSHHQLASILSRSKLKAPSLIPSSIVYNSNDMAERNNAMRPLLRRMLSFREPLLIIPYLLTFLAAAASAFVRSHYSLLHVLARALVVPAAAAAAKSAHGASPLSADDDQPAPRCGGGDEAEEEGAALSKDEVEAIMGAIGLAAAGRGEGLAAVMGRDEVSGLFDAEEPSFAEVRGAFAVFDADRDGFIGAADLQGALARLGVREDADACRAMIDAAGGGRDGRMSLFQFVGFLENGLC